MPCWVCWRNGWSETLCRACKEPYHPAKGEFDGLVRAYDGDFDRLGFSYDDHFTLFRAKGCSKCGHTGYSGRTAIHELLVGTDDIKHMIQNRSKVKELKAQGGQGRHDDPHTRGYSKSLSGPNGFFSGETGLHVTVLFPVRWPIIFYRLA